MYSYDYAYSYIVNELPKEGFSQNGSYFYRTVGGTTVIASVPRLDSSNVDSFSEKIIKNLSDFAARSGSRATGFVFIVPDERGYFKIDTPGYTSLYNAYDSILRAGIVVEFEILNLMTGEITKLGSGTVDRSVHRIVSNLSVASATARPANGQGPENGTPNDNSDMQYFSATNANREDVLRPVRRTSTLRFFGSANMVVVYILIALNVIAYILEVYVENTYNFDYVLFYGSQNNGLVLQGEYWRLFTAMFLHADIYHLLGNMLSLLYLGMVVSRFFSKLELLITYFASGLIGNLLSLIFLPKNMYSLGASGAVMGMGGVLIFMLFFSKNRKQFRSTGNFFSLGFMVFYNLVYGVIRTSSNINNFAHFGGFVAGFVIALIVEKVIEKKVQTYSEDGY